MSKKNLLWKSLTGLAPSSSSILCMHIVRLIPTMSCILYLIAFLFALSNCTTLSSCSDIKSLTMITGISPSSPRKAYFKFFRSSFISSLLSSLSSSFAFSVPFSFIALHFIIIAFIAFAFFLRMISCKTLLKITHRQIISSNVIIIQ